MEAHDAGIMGRGLGQVTGLAAFGLVVARLGRLLATGPSPADWQVILIASALLGGVTWWLVVRALTRQALGLMVFSIVALALFVRVSVPGSLMAGLIPGPGTLEALATEMAKAADVVRHGVPPVEPVGGLVAVLAMVSFLIGASFTWGALGGGSTAAVVVPPFVMYLQISVFDTRPVGLAWMSVSATVLALGMASMALGGRGEAGSTRDWRGAVRPRRSAPAALTTSATVAAIALVVANLGAVLAPESRLTSGGGPLIRALFGNDAQSFDRWVDLRQRLINPSGAIMFTAKLDDPAITQIPLYWRMEALDHFDGISWTRSDSSTEPYTAGSTITDLSESYSGTVISVTQEVEIGGLRTGAGIVPAAGSPAEVQPLSPIPGALQPSDFEIYPDGAIAYQSGVSSGHSYRLISQVQDINGDLGALASGPEGVLSPLFAAAFEAGQWDHPPVVQPEVAAPADLTRYMTLPPGFPPSLAVLAREVTAGATTDFERAWMLQSWFRDSGAFTYSTEVSTGHRSLDLAAWLGDPASPNFRTGYCEQFAASMAVMARSLGMGSRVIWGFAPGEDVDGRIVVRDSNAHAWVELWIDGFGWVPFEPTPRSGILPTSLTAEFDTAEIASGLSTVPEPAPPPDPTPPPNTVPPASAPTWLTEPLWMAMAGILVLLSSVPFMKRVRRSRRMRRLSEGEVSAAWDEIVDRLQDLGTSISPAWTPLELADRMDPRLGEVAARYSAEIYGEQQGLGRRSDLEEAEGYLRSNFGTGRRVVAILNPGSLIRNL